ncbi:methylmalonyl-CoA mutase small subunit [Bacteroidales bacterium OttesenSCG-928-L03]|nr:methylmalonyl-CoA mutase small subunit [Bacteroidales bacterium OttesenSCG-928-L03]
MRNSKEKLFSDFPGISTDTWMAKITTDLKGADFEKKLVWKTNEGFSVRPFYRAEDIEGLKTKDSLPGEFPYVRGTKKDNDWFVRQDIVVEDFQAANAKALEILGKGINSLGFKIKGKEVSAENVAVLLEGICAECIELNFSTCPKSSAKLTQILVAYFKEKGYDPAKIQGSVSLDYIKPMLTKGKVKPEWVEQMKEAVEAASDFRSFRVIGVNAYLLNDAGSYITQELGYALAWGNEILSRLVDAGVQPAVAANNIKFNFGISANYFMEIAKFRAARWLWAEIVKAYIPEWEQGCPVEGADRPCQCAAKMNIFAQTSRFNQTIYDAHVNMLRTQTEAMSATIAGVDSLLVSPFDESFRTPDEFSERIARNQQLLLKEECHFDKVVDASGGSYYIENLTNSIAQEAWKLFLSVEEKGFYEMVLNGEVQNAVNASAEKRFKALAGRREVLLGTNQFPNFTELAADKIVNQEEKSHCGCTSECAATIPTLNKKRLGEEFEALRLSTEKSGKQVKAFMLTIGNLAMRLARAQFSCNFLACAGYQVIDNLGFDTVEAGVEAARKAGADIIVLCSSDDEYATYGPEAYELTQGKEILAIAGAPACTDDLKALGVEYFINVRSNVLDTLKSLNTKLGM